jgi:hypothetical protein
MAAVLAARKRFDPPSDEDVDEDSRVSDSDDWSEGERVFCAIGAPVHEMDSLEEEAAAAVEGSTERVLKAVDVRENRRWIRNNGAMMARASTTAVVVWS